MNFDQMWDHLKSYGRPGIVAGKPVIICRTSTYETFKDSTDPRARYAETSLMEAHIENLKLGHHTIVPEAAVPEA